MRKVKRGGGWPAVWYTWTKAREAGGLRKLWRAMRSRNACKTCALGMGGQRGGMVNEQGHFPEVCKKSLQAMVADMQGAIKPEFWRRFGARELRAMTPRELEHCGRLVEPVLYTPELGRYQPISWDDAFERIASKLTSMPADETFWYFSGRSSNEAGFLLQLFARLYGTNNVNNCSLLLPPGERRRSGQRHRQRHRDDRAGRRGQERPGVRDRRQPGVATTRG